MSEFLHYSYMHSTPTTTEVVDKIRDCRTVLREHVNGAPLCEGEALATVEDFAARYQSCMDCHQAVSHARGLVGHTDSDLQKAFLHIDGVIGACTATLGANNGRIPPVVHLKK